MQSKATKRQRHSLMRENAKTSKAKTFQQLANAPTGIEFYQKGHEISPDLNVDEIEVTAYQCLGYNQLQAGQYQESIK